MRKKYTHSKVLSFRLRETDADLARALAVGRDETFSDLVRDLLLDEIRRDAVQHLERQRESA